MARGDGGRGAARGVVGLNRPAGVRGEEGDRQVEGLARRRGRGDQLVGPPGEEIRGVELGLPRGAVGDQRPVLVDRVTVEVVGRGVDRAVPVVEARRHLGLGRDLAVAVEELAHVHGPVARGLQPQREPVRLVEARVAAGGQRIAEYAVVVRVLAGVERGARGTAERVVDEAPRERRSPTSEQRHGLRHHRHRVERLVVGHQHDDVRLGRGRGSEREQDHGGEGERVARAHAA